MAELLALPFVELKKDYYDFFTLASNTCDIDAL